MSTSNPQPRGTPNSLRTLMFLGIACVLLSGVPAAQGQVTPYSGQMITNPTGTLTFTWHSSVPLIAYQEAGLQVSCNSYDQGQGCTKCCRPYGFSLGGYYYGGGVQQLVTITRADGGAMSALEFQAGDYYNGCSGVGDGTIYLWALVSSGGNVYSFDINAPAGSYVGFSGVFDMVQVGAYVNGSVRDLHSQTAAQAIAMDNMRYVSSPCPAFAAPANIFACADGALAFSVAPIAAAPISYQWQWQPLGGSQWFDIAEGVNAAAAPFAFTATGSQSAMLTRSGGLTPGSVVLYRCVVSNACSSIVGAPASLAIRPAPTISEQPQDEPLCSAPGYASFSVQADTSPSDPGPFTYQWQTLRGSTWRAVTDSENITGSTTPYLTIVFDATDVAAKFRCVVTNPCSSTISTAASLTFGNAPVVASQPIGTKICPGGTGAFDVQSAGTLEPTYQWGVESPPASGQYLDLPDNDIFVDPATGMNFYAYGTQTPDVSISQIVLGQHPGAIRFIATLTNNCGSVTSNSAALTVCAADFNCSGDVTIQDLFDFLGAWFTRDASADFNNSGSVTIQDLFDFLAVWFARC